MKESKNTRKAREASGLAIGDKAPSFAALDQHDEPFDLSDALARGAVLLIFYRGQWCPFCNKHLRTLQQNLSRIREKGATVVAVSPETSPFLRRTMEKTGAQFSLLHDQDYRIADAYDVAFRPDAVQRFMYNSMLGARLKEAQADDRPLLPIPATYLVAPEGKIAWRHFDPDYKKRSSTKAILSALEAL